MAGAASLSNEETLRNSNVRLCRLCVWPNFEGLGFNLEQSSKPPHVIRLVESNSPAAAGGLKILDVVLAVNNQDVSDGTYDQLRNAIRAARDRNIPVELLVCEFRFYQNLKKKNIRITPQSATVHETPSVMPADYLNFPKHQPRTCEIKLRPNDNSFGFEVVNGEGDVGAYVQEVFTGSPAANSGLRKSDRIIEIDDKNVDGELSTAILAKLGKAKTKKGVKLFVADTDTYKHYKQTKQKWRKSRSAERGSKRSSTSRHSQPPPMNGSQMDGQTPTTARHTPTQSMNQSVPDLTYRPPIPSTGRQSTTTSFLPPPPPSQEDIRLCTIHKGDPSDSFGIELNYHRKELLHSLTISPGRNDGPSNAEQAGVKTDDRLIEINGANVQTLDHESVTQLIKKIKYPEPLRILVADTPTYTYYKQQNKVIHSALPTVKKMPANTPVGPLPTPTSSHSSHSQTRPMPPPPFPTHEQPRIPTPTIDNTAPAPSSSIFNSIARENPLSPGFTTHQSMQPRHVPLRKDAQLLNGVGFNFRTNPNDALSSSSSSMPYSHVVTSIDNNAPIGAQGLRVNDHILSINDENVEILSHDQLKDKLRRIANSETVRLLVADDNVYRVYQQSSHGQISAIGANTRPPTSAISEPKSSSNSRQYRLQRNPGYEGFGFGVHDNSAEGLPHQISSVEQRSPAQQQGLRAGDYILRVNNTDVQNLNRTDFNDLMRNAINNESNRDGTMLLEVMDEDTYRSLHRRTVVPHRMQPSPVFPSMGGGTTSHVPSRGRSPAQSSYEPYQPSPSTDSGYPKMRQCHIRQWPHYRDLGFQIIQSHDAPAGGGYQIHQLRLDSPAAHTAVRNDDHLIEVNNINVETTAYQSVSTILNDSYRRDGHVSLLLIDDDGYKWYKRNRFRIDPTSQSANISRHVTPDNQAVFTSGDSSVISPPARYTPNEPMPAQNEIHIPSTAYQPISTSRPPSTGLSNRGYPYTNGYVSPSRGHDSYQRQPLAPSVTSTLSHTSRLSRAAVDVVDGKTMLRFCRLNTDPGQPFGFELKHNENGHIINNVKPNSPAARAGLHDEDRLIEVNDENVKQVPLQEVIGLIKNANNNGVLRVLISPSNVKPLTVKSGTRSSNKAKSLPSLTDDRIYNDGGADPYNSWVPYNANFGGQQQQQSPMVRYMSTSRIDNTSQSQQPMMERPYSAHGFDTYQRQQYRSGSVNNQPFLPIDPWPRKCTLIRDPSFAGCGFKLLERESYDTPIVVEVRHNSPAKRSGLTEGDHIIYIDARNVQAIQSFDEMTQLIHQSFEQNGQVTLVTLTSPAYQVLKRKGGYLQPDPFDYQSPYIRDMAPRFCRIFLLDHEHDFGFTLQRGNPIHIKDVHPGTAAYEHGLKPHDKLIEINGHDTLTMSADQIIDLIESCKRKRLLNVLVIDANGFNFSLTHAIPLNSNLPFVQQSQRRALSSRPTHQQPVYL